MHAAARGEIGSAEAGTVGAGAFDGALSVLACGKLELLAAVDCGVSCGFTSSFLHIRHLGGHRWIFEVVGLEGGATQKL